MGADISLPEDNQAELTSEAVVGLIGQSYFNQEKWKEVTGDSNVITVEELRKQINAYAKDQIEAMGKPDINLNDLDNNGEEEMTSPLKQDSTMELDDGGTHDDIATHDEDDEGDATGDRDLNNMDESTLLPESTRDVDDFTAGPSIITVNRVVMKLPQDEFMEKHRSLKILYQELRESCISGVISNKKKKEKLNELHELLTIYYDQTEEFFIMKNKKEKMFIFIAEYYYLIDHYPKGRDFMRFYTKGSQLKISGLHNFDCITDAKPIAIALLKTYRGIKVQHKVLDIAIEQSKEQDSFWDLFLTVSSLVKLDKDEPRKVVEFFYLKERVEDEFRAMYGQYYIKKQVLVDQGFRPFWCYSEITDIPDQDYRNFDESVGKPSWLLDKEEKEFQEEEEKKIAASLERKRIRKLIRAGLRIDDDSEEEDSEEEEEEKEGEEELDDDGNVIKKKKSKAVKDPEFVDLEPNDDDDQSKSSLLSSKIVKKLPKEDVVEGEGEAEGEGGGEGGEGGEGGGDQQSQQDQQSLGGSM